MKDILILFNNTLEKINLASDKKEELIFDFNKFGFTERLRHRLIAFIDREIEESKKNISQLKSRLNSLNI